MFILLFNLKSIKPKSDILWKKLLDTNELNSYKFILNEWWENSENQLSDNEESLVSHLMVDRYHIEHESHHRGQIFQILSNLKK